MRPLTLIAAQQFVASGSKWPLFTQLVANRANRERQKSTCAVTRRRFSSGCKPRPAIAPAGSNRGRHGGDEMSEAFGYARPNATAPHPYSTQAAVRGAPHEPP